MAVLTRPDGYQESTPEERDQQAREYLGWVCERDGVVSPLLESDELIDLGDLPPVEELEASETAQIEALRAQLEG